MEKSTSRPVARLSPSKFAPELLRVLCGARNSEGNQICRGELGTILVAGQVELPAYMQPDDAGVFRPTNRAKANQARGRGLRVRRHSELDSREEDRTAALPVEAECPRCHVRQTIPRLTP